MEEYIQKDMSEQVIEAAAYLYGVKLSQIKKIGGFENFIFEFSINTDSFILRFVHSGHRTYEQVLAELEFIEYLDSNNSPVSTVIHSINDKIVEKLNISDNKYFSVCVFEKAPGNFVVKDDLTDEFYVMFGEEIGKLHKLTKSFIPINKRIDWTEENYMEIAVKVLEKKDDKIIEIYAKLLEKLKKLPKNNDNFGLIHTDLHFHNMYIYSGELTFFDWDDSSYKHFISDIAIVLFYHFMYKEQSQEDINVQSRRILALLIKGYRRKNNIDISFFQNLNDFLLLRSIVVYIVLVAAGATKSDNQFIQRYFSKTRISIIENTPFLDLDFVLKGLNE